ncbi:MAG: hypothetical protein J0L81_15685 [Caulobacterales bacterium]|nr:hypothetical protein [Caulobacterales bacterium]
MRKMKIRNFVVAAALALAAPSWVSAQETTGGDDIVVTGTRLQEIVRDFVGEVSVAPGSENQLARWDRRICPGIIGLQNAQQAQYLVDRIAQRAQLVGIEAERPGCRANVVVFVTPDSDRIAREIGQEYRQLVAYHSAANAVTQGQGELTRFMETSRPVRWWHVSQTVTADGQVLGESNARPTASGGFAGVEVVRQPDAGRLRRSTRQDFSRVIIIVDATRAAGVQFSTLADYVAMAALAQIAPDADTSAAPTILSLFSDREAGRTPPAALTDWDVAYLTGLYEAPRAARNSQAQEGAIARTMSEELTTAPANP